MTCPKNKDQEHIYEFQDFEETSEDIYKIHLCKCGAKMIDRYTLIDTEYKEAEQINLKNSL